MFRWLTLTLLVLAMTSCQTDTRSEPPPGSRGKYDGGDRHRDRSSDSRRSSGCCLQAPTDY